MLQRPARTEPTGGRGRLGPGTGTPDEKIRNQLRTLVAVDEGVGQILEALEQTGQLDNTLIIYSSDNGYFWGEHGLSDKRAAYEDSIRIPLIMRYPKRIKGGTLIDRLTVNADIAATALDVAGVPIPANVHGRSLVPLFNSRRAKWRDAFLAEYMQEARYPFIPGWQAVRSERWKYIHYTEQDGMDELYDLKADPYEMKNLIDDATAGTALKRVKADLDRLLGETR
jgi:N-acetylglucosamine-6-sulfatase